VRLWKRLAVAIGVLALLAGILIAWVVFHLFAFGIDNAYAQWGAADMVIGYMEKHDGRWPKSWEDLRPEFEAGGGRVGGWSFEKLCSRVWVDWNPDPKALETLAVRCDKPCFDVIHPADGIDVRFGGRPNAILHAYFKAKADKQK
jgi:hypothetical protein